MILSSAVHWLKLFLEDFYEKGSYGILTTHYANLKKLANELPDMSNANMMFDSRTLEPVYKLQVGEAGSSFTFEVAQKMESRIALSTVPKRRSKEVRYVLTEVLPNFRKNVPNYAKQPIL